MRTGRYCTGLDLRDSAGKRAQDAPIQFEDNVVHDGKFQIDLQEALNLLHLQRAMCWNQYHLLCNRNHINDLTFGFGRSTARLQPRLVYNRILHQASNITSVKCMSMTKQRTEMGGDESAASSKCGTL